MRAKLRVFREQTMSRRKPYPQVDVRPGIRFMQVELQGPAATPSVSFETWEFIPRVYLPLCQAYVAQRKIESKNMPPFQWLVFHVGLEGGGGGGCEIPDTVGDGLPM